MPSFEFTLLTILGCTLATWLSRVLPFVLLKKFDLPQPLLEQSIYPKYRTSAADQSRKCFGFSSYTFSCYSFKKLIGDRLGRNSFPFVDSLIINKKTRAYGKLLSCALVFIKVK